MTSYKKTLVFMIVVAAYMLLGMLTFYHLEKGHEEEVLEARIPLENLTAKFLASHTSLNETVLNSFLVEVLKADSNRTLKWSGATTSGIWTYTNSIYFAVTVITTIGFGNIAPYTSKGRLFCVIYAFFGIPLCLTLLVDLGAQMFEKCQNAVDFVLGKFGIKLTLKVRVIKTTIIVFILGLNIFILLPSLMFYKIEEGWQYADACYFAFVTIATIGFGDIVAGADTSVLSETEMIFYRIGISLWIFLGLAWLSTLTSAVQNVIEHTIEKGEQKLEHKIHKLKKHHEEHEHHKNGTEGPSPNKEIDEKDEICHVVPSGITTVTFLPDHDIE